MRSPAPIVNNNSVNEGRSETTRCAGRRAVRPSGRQAARRRTANRRRRNTIPPAREPTGGANEDVSWLRAIQLAFPGYPSGIEPITALPVTVAGPRRSCTGFRIPIREIELLAQSRRGRSPAQCPHQRDHHADREQRDDVRHQHLRSEFSAGQPNLDFVCRRKRTSAIRGEMSPLELFHAERFEFRRADHRGGVLDQQIHFVGRLIDRNYERARAGGKRVAIADLLHRPGWNRREYDHAVVAELHRVARDVALPAAELSRPARDGGGPCGKGRIGWYTARD